MEAKLSETGKEEFTFQDLENILNDTINTLTKIDVIYCKSDSEMQRKLIGSIYPEKFTFEELKDRTAKISDPFKLIYLINNKLGRKKSGTTDQNFALSRLVLPELQITNQFLEDLKKIASLSDFSARRF